MLYGRHLPLKSAVVFGGVKINPQMQRMCKGADILVATPGRLIDLYNQNAVKFDQLEILVLDEQIACSTWALFVTFVRY